jgi:uncharacterized protein (DUF2141 family)
MKKNLIHILLILGIALLVVQCAKRGSPTGGPIDEEPPQILRASPDNFTTNFENEEIEITFNEYIKLDNIQRQLVVSPPLKYKPIIKPQGGASKKLTIEILDTLADNTTYVFNFGQSIVDNTEANPYPFFKYVFSTGDKIDSLTLQGRISDALNFKVDDFVNVLLFEVDSTYTDSVIYNESPRYVVNTLDSLTTFTMENLKAGDYRLVALKEKSDNLRFDPASDKIGFISEIVTIPTDQNYELQLYDPIESPSIKRADQVGESKINIGYTGRLDSMVVEPVNRSIIQRSRTTKTTDADTLQYWYRPVLNQDSILLQTRYQDFVDTVSVRLSQERAADSLNISKTGKFDLRQPLQITSSTPITDVNPRNMRLIDRDSVAVDFTTRLEFMKNIVTIDFPKTENNRYSLQLFPNAISDFYGSTNDSLNFVYTTRSNADYGNIIADVSQGTQWPVILQIVKSDLTVVEERVITGNGVYEFNLLEPGNYYVRSIYDTNRNNRYDPGNFMKNRQPERVVYQPELINLLANWDWNEFVILE